ncbi:MAG TPA: pimeloyl-ACP methyl ester esterase BioH [Steroidobacteraceae bacterium]|jgi:pimeloyl-[acyl-carrier protein] methyl ester esterase
MSERASPALYRETRGHGEPVVLLHGWGMNLRIFDALRDALASQHEVTSIDLPGHGRSGWDAPADAQHQLEWLGANLPRSATLIGWSLGGQLALQLADRAAVAARRLVLIATSPRFVSSADWPYGLPTSTLQRFGQQLAADPDATVAEFLELQVRGSVAGPAVLERLQRSLREHGSARPEALQAGLTMLEHNDLRALARGIELPVLLIAGQYDRVTSPQAAQALSQMLPQAQLLKIRRAGHAPFLSHAAQVTSALLDFTRAGAHTSVPRAALRPA